MIASEEISIVSLLQKYSLEKLNVVGVWRLENGKSKALIMTPKDEGVVVTTGDSLGRRGGKIVKIDDDKVIVREFSLASDGTRQFEDQQIWLGAQKPEEQEKSIRMRSQVLGLPNWFGYGSKNYLESDDFSEKRKNLLENNKLDLAPKVKGKEDSGKSENSDQSPEEDLPNKPADDLQKEEGHK
ncbi:MAG: pilus assembly protein PilP [Oligoflexales bacterium]|nr:pilus assembly protein PilP [Oligoflexales bacterium]